MNDNLDHLPASKQKHLAYIAEVLRDEFEQITGFATGKKKHSRILKIILFGSHATGNWVNDQLMRLHPISWVVECRCVLQNPLGVA